MSRRRKAGAPRPAPLFAVAAVGLLAALVALLALGTGPSSRQAGGGGGGGAEGGGGVEASVVQPGASGDDPDAPVPAPGPVERDESLPGRHVTSFEVCEEVGTLVSTARGSLGYRATWELGVGLSEGARSILEEYRDAGTVSLAYDGFLDLYGCVWGCVVSSEEGWAELVVVEDEGDGVYAGDGGVPEGEAPGCTLTLVRVERESAPALVP